MRIKTINLTEELSISDRAAARRAAIALGVKRAITRGLAGSEEGLIARQAENIADFGSAADQWLTGALNVLGTAYTVFNNIAAPALANNKVAVFFKVGVETAPMPVSLLSFRQGAAGGTTFAIFDLEQLINALSPDGYFSEPIVYEPAEVLNVTVTCRIATLLQARVQLGCYIIEPIGPTISG